MIHELNLTHYSSTLYRWDEDFIVELEGSENLRILVYEQQPGSGNVLRGRATLELSRNWLTSRMVEQRISMNDVVLTCGMRFAAFEETVRRVPAVKSTAGLFGTGRQFNSIQKCLAYFLGNYLGS